MQRIPVLVDETLNGTARGHGAAASHANSNLKEPVKRPRGRPPAKKPIDAPQVAEERTPTPEEMPRNDLIEFLEVISKMKFKDEPDYERLKGILRRPLVSSRDSSMRPNHITRNVNSHKVKIEPVPSTPDVEMIDTSTKPLRKRHPSEPNRRHAASPTPRSTVPSRQKSVERSLGPLAANDDKTGAVKHRLFGRHRSNDVISINNGLNSDNLIMPTRIPSSNESSNLESEVSKGLSIGAGKRDRKEGLRVVQENEVKLLKQKNLSSGNANINPAPKSGPQKRTKALKGSKVHPIIDETDAGPVKSASRPKDASQKLKNHTDPLHAISGIKSTAKETKLEKERKKVEEEVVALVNKRFKDENPTPAMIELYTRIEMKKRGFPVLPASSILNGH